MLTGEKKHESDALTLMAAIFWDLCWEGNGLCRITTKLQWNHVCSVSRQCNDFYREIFFTFREEERTTPNDLGLVHLMICRISMLISSDFLCGGRRQRDRKL